MDWMQFTSAIVGSLAWPLAVIAVVMLLRTPLSKLLPMVRALKYKELSIDFSEKLDAVKEEIGADTPGEFIQLPYTSAPSITELAQIDPLAAIIGAWVDVELALIELAVSAGMKPTGTPQHIASCLHLDDLLSDLEFQTFKDLRELRNKAIHLTALNLSSGEAEEVAGLCKWLAHRIRMTNANLPGKSRS